MDVKNNEVPNHEPSEFGSSGEALQKLGKDFNDWCSILTSQSIQVAYAVIAANWAVHSSKNAILENLCARYSMVTVFIFLGLNVLMTRLMSHLHFKQYLYAEENTKRWKKEFDDSRGKRTPWPYTKSIENLGEVMRITKTWLPVIGAVLFLMSLFI